MRNFPGKLHLSFITFCCITPTRDAVNIATSHEYLTSANSSSLLEQLLQMSLVRNTFSFPKLIVEGVFAVEGTVQLIVTQRGARHASSVLLPRESESVKRNCSGWVFECRMALLQES